MKAQGISISKGVAELVELDIGKPRRNEVLIETKACGICMGEVYIYQGKLPGNDVMGHEGVGIVSEVGEEVKNVKQGDKVTSLGGPSFAQFYRANCHNVSKIPDDVEDFTLWISEPATCVVNGVRGSQIQIGDKVCLVGCGYMGLLLIQALPKTHIDCLIAIDIQDNRLDLARKFGADYVINPKKVNALEEVNKISGGQADVVIEASGAQGTLYFATDLVRSGGKLVIFGRHVVDEKVPTEKWHCMGLTILNTAPLFSLNFNRDFQDAVKLLEKGVFDQKYLITHRFLYNDPMKAFETASKKHVDYIKGVIIF